MSGDKSNVEKGSLTEEQHKGVKNINFNFNRAKTLLDRETNIKFLSFKGNNFFLYVGNFILPFAKSNAMIIPWHDCLFPVYPSLQVKLWQPSVLVQFAFMSLTCLKM